MIYRPHDYQATAEDHLHDNPYAGLFMQMGLGKTVVVLTALVKWIENFEAGKTLVIAPKRTADSTWPAEIEKWAHTSHLTYSKILGTEAQRKAALKTQTDIYIINRENVPWLVAHYGLAWPFDCVIVDESSSFKSHKAQRFKALKQVRPKIQRVVLLTGSPAANSLLDLWPQLYLLDRGQRLGETFEGFRQRFFRKDPHKPYADYKIIREDDELIGEGYYEKKIYDKIGDICISMKTEDYLKLPEKIIRDYEIRFDGETKERYEDFEKKAVLELMDDEGEISAVNAAALSNKLLQFANGAVYDDTKNFHQVHDDKLEALEEIVEAAVGKPVLVFYNFKHDLERIKARVAKYKPVTLKTDDDIKRWNKGEISILLAHPASAGHGLNLQAGGSTIVWFGLPWSLELYEQANARLHRQGQLQIVIIHRLIAKGTMDEDVAAALDRKTKSQDALMRAVKARVVKYTGASKTAAA